MDLLDHSRPFPGGYDVIWMSQFLVCFPEADIVRFLERARDALGQRGALYILDTYWDRQKYDIAAYCLINSSPYFTCLANGNSRMYRSDEMVRFAAAAGLRVDEQTDGLGLGHTLLRCVPGGQ